MSNLASMIDVRSVRYSCSFVLVFYQWLAAVWASDCSYMYVFEWQFARATTSGLVERLMFYIKYCMIQSSGISSVISH